MFVHGHYHCHWDFHKNVANVQELCVHNGLIQKNPQIHIVFNRGLCDNRYFYALDESLAERLTCYKYRRHDIHHNGSKQNGIQQQRVFTFISSVTVYFSALCHYAEWHSAQCCSDECHGATITAKLYEHYTCQMAIPVTNKSRPVLLTTIFISYY
jgi:hypothetical protein